LHKTYLWFFSGSPGGNNKIGPEIGLIFYPFHFAILLIEHQPVLCVEKGDILTLACGLIIVLVIAVVANPQYLAPLRDLGGNAAPTPAIVPTTRVTPAIVNPTPPPVMADATPYQIFYTDKPYSYPVFKLPENMEIYGASDIVSRRETMVPFAFVEDKRGGLTQKFSVPYPLWIINTTVIANKTPQYGDFRMTLCYASNGTIIDGEEILNRGTSYRVVQISHTDLYMIISTAYIDSYRINLEAPRNYYDIYRPR
jgi:hypothetical protein